MPASDVPIDLRLSGAADRRQEVRMQLSSLVHASSGTERVAQKGETASCFSRHSGVLCASSRQVTHALASRTLDCCLIWHCRTASARRDAPGARYLIAANLCLCDGRVQLTLTAISSQMLQVRCRFVSARALRAAWRAASSSSGAWFPVLKYISSGVCPRNAECGRRVLCSCT